MKKTFRIFLAISIVTLLTVSVMIAASAESARRVDPASLAPTSDRVVFIMDAPEGKELEGDGTGTDFANPYIPSDHEKFNPAADYPENYYQTSLYQATEMLGSTGGTIVICGPVRLGLEESYGSGSDTKDVYTYNWGTKQTIKFTSVYNGVDYRETNGAKLVIEHPAELGVRGTSMWENLDIVTVGTKRIISFGSFPTLIGKGVNCYPEDDVYAESAANYISLSGGHRYAKGDDQIPTLTVQSGTYNVISGGIWGVSASAEMANATVYLTLEGSTTVLGQVIGTVYQNSQFSGHVNITINGGKYPCDIYGVGRTGLKNEDGTVDLVINGGDFSGCWSINAYDSTAPNNPPAASILDFTEFRGSKTDLAAAFAVTTEFSQVKFPGTVTEDELIELAGKTETEPVETEPATDAPEETDVVEDKNEEEEKKDEDEGKIDVSNTQSGIPAWVWIVVAAVAVFVIFGTVVLVVVMKQKK